MVLPRSYGICSWPRSQLTLAIRRWIDGGLRRSYNRTNALGTRFAGAYSAAFWLARVALEAAGYRLAGAEGHRTMVYQCLALTVEWENLRWRRLDDPHRLRNRFDYGDIVDVSESQVKTMIADARALLDDVQRIFPDTKS